MEVTGMIPERFDMSTPPRPPGAGREFRRRSDLRVAPYAVTSLAHLAQ
jgi:hypothetical protein